MGTPGGGDERLTITNSSIYNTNAPMLAGTLGEAQSFPSFTGPSYTNGYTGFSYYGAMQNGNWFPKWPAASGAYMSCGFGSTSTITTYNTWLDIRCHYYDLSGMGVISVPASATSLEVDRPNHYEGVPRVKVLVP